MITEDFVSFEVARLLKEKGFDSESVGDHGGFYSEKCYEPGQGVKTQSGQEVGIVYDDLTNSELDYDEYLRPTTQMAMKWLRETHNIHIEVGLQENINEDKFQYRIKLFNPETSTWVLNAKVHNWDTYEAACDAAIKYCIKILVNDQSKEINNDYSN